MNARFAGAEYDSATGTFIIPVRSRRSEVPSPSPPAEPPPEPQVEPEPAPPPEPAPEPEPPPPPEPHIQALEPIPLRHRHDGWTPEKQRLFLEELADCGIVREAAARVGMSAQSACSLRRRAEGKAFGRAWEAALIAGARRLHAVAFERAILGTVKRTYYQGKVIGEDRQYDTRLLLALLGKLGGPFDAVAARPVRRDWESWLKAVELRLPAPVPKLEDEPLPEFAGAGHPLLQDEDGTWWTSLAPPPGFRGAEHGAWGSAFYCRTLTEEEQAFVAAEQEQCREESRELRDAWFTAEE